MLKMMPLVLAGAALLTAAMTAGPVAAATAPGSVTVTPSAGLAGGATVKVAATGITPLASVQVIQCNNYDTGDSEDNCSPLLTTTASNSGGISVKLKLADPVWQSQDIGDSIPNYCRADHCHIFVTWTDSSNEPQVASSPRLWFKGSPATITASPATKLHGRQLITVSGTAFGAQGHQIEVLEEACYTVVQGSGCYGQLPAITSAVARNGKYQVRYRVRQHLADGTDCNDPNILGFCELSVIVLTKGKPDDSFGVSSIGEPAAQITFLGSGQRPSPRS